MALYFAAGLYELTLPGCAREPQHAALIALIIETNLPDYGLPHWVDYVFHKQTKTLSNAL